MSGIANIASASWLGGQWGDLVARGAELTPGQAQRRQDLETELLARGEDLAKVWRRFVEARKADLAEAERIAATLLARVDQGIGLSDRERKALARAQARIEAGPPDSSRFRGPDPEAARRASRSSGLLAQAVSLPVLAGLAAAVTLTTAAVHGVRWLRARAAKVAANEAPATGAESTRRLSAGVV